MTCRVPECERPAFSRGLCQGHVKQEQRGLPFTPLRERLDLYGADLLVKCAAVAYVDLAEDLTETGGDRTARAYAELLRAAGLRLRLDRDGLSNTDE